VATVNINLKEFKIDTVHKISLLHNIINPQQCTKDLVILQMGNQWACTFHHGCIVLTNKLYQNKSVEVIFSECFIRAIWQLLIKCPINIVHYIIEILTTYFSMVVRWLNFAIYNHINNRYAYIYGGKLTSWCGQEVKMVQAIIQPVTFVVMLHILYFDVFFYCNNNCYEWNLRTIAFDWKFFVDYTGGVHNGAQLLVPCHEVAILVDLYSIHKEYSRLRLRNSHLSCDMEHNVDVMYRCNC